MEITIHQEKITHFTFHGKKKGRSRVTKIPLSTLSISTNAFLFDELVILTKPTVTLKVTFL